MNTILVVGFSLLVVGPPQQPTTHNASVRVSVLGEGRLRFATGRQTLAVASATLSRNPQGLLADAAGRPVSPALRIPLGALKITMNGTVSVAGREVGRLVLERKGAKAVEIGFPGEDGFGVVRTESSSPQVVKPLRKTDGLTLRDLKTSPPRISVRGSSEVAGERVRLGDIADIEADPETAARLAALDLGSLPPLGGRRTLGKWALQAALRDAGFPESRLVFPPDVTVRRQGQTVATPDLVAPAQALLGPTFTLSSAPFALVVPCGTATFQAVAKPPVGDATTVEVTVLVDGKPAGSRLATFRDATPGIRAGDPVRVSVVRGGAVVELDARAKTTGRVGGTVQVAGPDGAVLTATVTGPGKAEVKA